MIKAILEILGFKTYSKPLRAYQLTDGLITLPAEKEAIEQLIRDYYMDELELREESHEVFEEAL